MGLGRAHARPSLAIYIIVYTENHQEHGNREVALCIQFSEAASILWFHWSSDSCPDVSYSCFGCRCEICGHQS